MNMEKTESVDVGILQSLKKRNKKRRVSVEI
jgi:hypothetical protein